MTPQELLNRLVDIQNAANTVTINHMALSNSIGEFIAFLGGDADLNEVTPYRDAVIKHLMLCTDSLDAFCTAVNKLGGK